MLTPRIGHEEIDISQADTLHRLIPHADDRRCLRDREREPIDDLRNDLASHGDLLRPRVVSVRDDLSDGLSRSRRRNDEVPRDHDEHVQLCSAQLRQGLVRRELRHQEGVDPLEDLDELRARWILGLIVDGERHATEIAEVQVAKYHHQHQRHDEAEEEGRAIAQVGAKEQREKAESLPHASRIS